MGEMCWPILCLEAALQACELADGRLSELYGGRQSILPRGENIAIAHTIARVQSGHFLRIRQPLPPVHRARYSPPFPRAHCSCHNSCGVLVSHVGRNLTEPPLLRHSQTAAEGVDARSWLECLLPRTTAVTCGNTWADWTCTAFPQSMHVDASPHGIGTNPKPHCDSENMRAALCKAAAGGCFRRPARRKGSSPETARERINVKQHRNPHRQQRKCSSPHTPMLPPSTETRMRRETRKKRTPCTHPNCSSRSSLSIALAVDPSMTLSTLPVAEARTQRVVGGEKPCEVGSFRSVRAATVDRLAWMNVHSAPPHIRQVRGQSWTRT